MIHDPPAGTIQQQFDAFHAANPWVYDELVNLTRQLVRRGRQQVGMKMLFEVLRWEYLLNTTDPSSSFKLNNNMHSRYARLIMAREPDLRSIYEVRMLKSA